MSDVIKIGETRLMGPEFKLGDIVVSEKYPEHGEMVIVQIYYSTRRNDITYGTQPAVKPESEGMTDEWKENDLRKVSP
jgi:hypothetical protein